MRIRQVVLVAEELEPTRELLQRLFGIEESFRDPPDSGVGIVNVVMPVGDTFLEVVSPMRPDATTRRYLDRTGGDGGYMLIVQYPEFAPAVRRAEGHGARFVWKIDFPDQRQWHLHPKDIGGAIVAIDWADSPSRWRWAGDDWQDHVGAEVVDVITGIEVSAPDPGELSRRWQRLLAAEPAGSDGGTTLLRLGESSVTVKPWDREFARITAVNLRVKDRAELERRATELGLTMHHDQIDAAGVTFRLV